MSRRWIERSLRYIHRYTHQGDRNTAELRYNGGNGYHKLVDDPSHWSTRATRLQSQVPTTPLLTPGDNQRAILSLRYESCKHGWTEFAAGSGTKRWIASNAAAVKMNEDPKTEIETTPEATMPVINMSKPPVSLEYERTPSVPTAPEGQSTIQRLLLWIGGYYSKQSVQMRAASSLNAAINEHALNPVVLRALHVPDTDFQHKHAMLCLHVWMVIRRLRLEGRDGNQLAQVMYDNFQDDVEHLVRKAGVQIRLQKHLTDLEKQFYGSAAAYDRALSDTPTEPLSATLFRNVYQRAEGKEDASKLLETYVLRAIACLAKTPSEAIMAGQIRF